MEAGGILDNYDGTTRVDSRIVSCKPKNDGMTPFHDEVTSQIRYLGLALGRVKDWFWSRLAFKYILACSEGLRKEIVLKSIGSDVFIQCTH